MNEDGACLFRAIADQIFGDQELHHMVRTSCMDYIVSDLSFFIYYLYYSIIELKKTPLVSTYIIYSILKSSFVIIWL